MGEVLAGLLGGAGQPFNRWWGWAAGGQVMLELPWKDVLQVLGVGGLERCMGNAAPCRLSHHTLSAKRSLSGTRAWTTLAAAPPFYHLTPLPARPLHRGGTQSSTGPPHWMRYQPLRLGSDERQQVGGQAGRSSARRHALLGFLVHSYT